MRAARAIDQNRLVIAEIDAEEAVTTMPLLVHLASANETVLAVNFVNLNLDLVAGGAKDCGHVRVSRFDKATIIRDVTGRKEIVT